MHSRLTAPERRSSGHGAPAVHFHPLDFLVTDPGYSVIAISLANRGTMW